MYLNSRVRAGKVSPRLENGIQSCFVDFAGASCVVTQIGVGVLDDSLK